MYVYLYEVLMLWVHAFHLLAFTNIEVKMTLSFLIEPYYGDFWVKVKVSQLCPTLCDPIDYTVHGILQARILKRVACPFSRGSSQLKDWTQVSHIAGGFFTSWATREAQEYWSG